MVTVMEAPSIKARLRMRVVLPVLGSPFVTPAEKLDSLHKARFVLQGALSPMPFLMGRHRHRTAANKRQRDEVLGGASNKSG